MGEGGGWGGARLVQLSRSAEAQNLFLFVKFFMLLWLRTACKGFHISCQRATGSRGLLYTFYCLIPFSLLISFCSSFILHILGHTLSGQYNNETSWAELELIRVQADRQCEKNFNVVQGFILRRSLYFHTGQ